MDAQAEDDERLLEAVPKQHVAETSLSQGARLLLPCLATTFPVFVVIAIAVHGQVPTNRLTVWLGSGLIAEIVALIALWRFRRGQASGRPASDDLFWIRLAALAVGAAWGATLFVPDTDNVELMLLFAVFTYGAGTFGLLLTTARTDLFGLFDISLFCLASFALMSASDPMLLSLGVLSLCYLGLGALAHRVAHATVVDAIESTWRAERLAEGLASEHQLLHDANASTTELNEKLAFQATHDPLTGLYNRRGAIDSLERALARATTESPVGLLYLDLDRFKHINDSLGHRGGDQVLAVIADRLARSIDPGATAGRIGGDEFIAVLPNCDIGASMAVATRITSVLAQPVHGEGREMPSSVSVGVAVGPAHGSGSSELLRHANAALHRAKASGRNRVEVFDGSVKSELHERLDSEQALRRALDDGDIVAFFQPEIDATTGQVVGAELLARWLRRDGTVATANEFIAVAAKAGLLERLTDHVMQQARPLIRRLSTLGLPEGFRFRVNLPPRATERSWRDNPVDALIQGIEPTLITVDVTESAVIDDLAAAAGNLASLRVRGVRVCLDDFARGVSSLSLLRRLPLDEVRIDRTSIDTITAHPHDRAIVRSIISLVREIGLTATADGVETGAQADVLIALGCIRHQGHLYSRALPASEFDSYLTRSMVERFAQGSMPLDAQGIGDYPLWPSRDLE